MFAILKYAHGWVKAHYGDSLWDVSLYHFPGVCMFECIPPQTFEKNSQCFLYIILEYNLGKIFLKILFHFIL
jgi:hypothetical protein